MRQELAGHARPLGGGSQIPCLLSLFGQPIRGIHCFLTKCQSHRFEPLLEPILIADCESLHELAAPVELEGILVPAGGYRLLEGRGVAPQRVGINSNRFVASNNENILAECPSQVMEGLAQGVACSCTVEVG